jgi:hypothetical protein
VCLYLIVSKLVDSLRSTEEVVEFACFLIARWSDLSLRGPSLRAFGPGFGPRRLKHQAWPCLCANAFLVQLICQDRRCHQRFILQSRSALLSNLLHLGDTSRICLFLLLPRNASMSSGPLGVLLQEIGLARSRFKQEGDKLSDFRGDASATHVCPIPRFSL